MNPAATPTRRQLHPPPAPASPFPYNPGSLLSASDLTLDAISHILARATALEAQDPLTRARVLAKRRVALLFYESSTRTRTSFELAAKALGAAENAVRASRARPREAEIAVAAVRESLEAISREGARRDARGRGAASHVDGSGTACPARQSGLFPTAARRAGSRGREPRPTATLILGRAAGIGR